MSSLRVVYFESRRTKEMAKLIASQGAEPVSAPALREVPFEDNRAALDFGEELLAGRYSVVIFLTGVGTRALFEVIEQKHSRADLVAALSKTAVIARGPKPAGILREYGVPITIAVPEPNTWRELIAELDARRDALPLTGRHVAVQEYGARNDDLLRELLARGAELTTVPVYRWALPLDLAPLRAGIEEIIGGRADIALFTTGSQVAHVVQVAREDGREQPLRDALSRQVLIGSIGPTCSEALREHGLPVDFEPQHPKMGFLVTECLKEAPVLLARKRGADV